MTHLTVKLLAPHRKGCRQAERSGDGWSERAWRLEDADYRTSYISSDGVGLVIRCYDRHCRGTAVLNMLSLDRAIAEALEEQG